MLATFTLLLGACAGEEGRILRAVEQIPLPAADVQTLAFDSLGRRWLGAGGALWIVDSATSPTRIAVPGEAAPRVIGWSPAGSYLRLGDSLFLVPPGGDSVTARRGDLGGNPLAVDVRGRAVYQGARSGALLAHHPGTLDPVWAWASLDARTTALALSPEGDRIYQALDGGEEGPRLLTRDLQTGRVLGRTDLRDPLQALTVASTGALYGLAVEGRRAIVVALRLQGHELAPQWRRSLSATKGGGEESISVAGGRILVQGLGSEGGIRLLSAEDGGRIGRTRSDPQDAAFGPGGSIWALYPGELRRLE